MTGTKTLVLLTITVGAIVALTNRNRNTSSAADSEHAPIVEVVPATAALAPGDSLKLRAALIDDAGQEITGQRFTWWSPDDGIASIDERGVVLAVSPGSVSIAAITEDRAHSGFAEITVTLESAATTSVPASGSLPALTRTPGDATGDPAPGPNEPDGYSALVRRPFDEFNERGWRDRHTGGNQTMSNGAMQIRFPAGFRGGYASGASNVYFAKRGRGYRSIYIAHDLLLSANWQGHRSLHNKVWYINTPDGRQSILSIKAFGGTGATEFPLVPTATQTKNSVQGRGKGSNLYPNLEGPKIRRGQRSSIEIIVTLNSAPGVQDGELHIWIDGGKTHEFSPARGNGINWYDSGDGDGFGQLKWTPVWGGGSDDTVVNAMYMEMSRVYLSAR